MTKPQAPFVTPGPAEVHIWLLPARYHAAVATTRGLTAALSAEEVARSRRYRAQADCDAYAASHVLLRRALARYTPACRPGYFRFVTGPYGRPELAGVPGAPRFSLSRTASWTACAISPSGALGADIEQIAPEKSEGIDRFFSPREARDLRALPTARQPRRFFELWTLKEAYLKARGTGLASPLDSFCFDLTAEGGITLATPAAGDDQHWQFRLTDLGGTLLATAIGTGLPFAPFRHRIFAVDQHLRQTEAPLGWTRTGGSRSEATVPEKERENTAP